MFAKFLPATQQKSSVRWFWTENTWLVLENITVWMEMVRLLVRNSWRCLQVSLQTSSLVVFDDSASWFERRRHRDTTCLALMSTWTDLQFCRNAACWHYFSETWLNWWRSSADVVLSWTSKHMRECFWNNRPSGQRPFDFTITFFWTNKLPVQWDSFQIIVNNGEFYNLLIKWLGLVDLNCRLKSKNKM